MKMTAAQKLAISVVSIPRFHNSVINILTTVVLYLVVSLGNTVTFILSQVQTFHSSLGQKETPLS